MHAFRRQMRIGLLGYLVVLGWAAPTRVRADFFTSYFDFLEESCPKEPPTPTVTIRVIVPACAAPKENLKYRICVENTSCAAAHHVLVRNPVPANAQFVTATPSPHSQKPELRWDLGTLKGGECREIMLILKPKELGEIDNCARVQFEHGQCVRTRIALAQVCARSRLDSGSEPPLVAQLRLEKKGPARAKQGDKLTFRLAITNAGGKPASEVRIVDTLPNGLEHASKKAVLTWEVGALPPGKTQIIEYQVVARKEGKWCNQAVVSAAGGLKEQAGACVLVGEPKLTLVKTGPKSRYLNIPATYLLQVSNPGHVPAQDVQVADVVPAGLVFVRASHDGQLVGNEVRWSLGTLNPGASRTVQMVVQAKEAGKVVNQAKATAAGNLSAAAEATTEFRGVSALMVELVDTEDPVEVNDVTSYRITIKNQGMVAATNIQIRALVPPEMQLLRANGPADNKPGAKTKDGQALVYDPLKSLAIGETVTYEVFVKAIKSGDVRFKVEVSADQLKAGGPVYEEESTTIFMDADAVKSRTLQAARLIWARLTK